MFEALQCMHVILLDGCRYIGKAAFSLEEFEQVGSGTV
jgi:hypothetical protein